MGKDRKEIALCLLNNKRIEVNMPKGIYENTVLHEYAESGKLWAVEMLFAYPSRENHKRIPAIYHKNKFGRMAISLAAKNGRVDVLRILLHHCGRPLSHMRSNVHLCIWPSVITTWKLWSYFWRKVLMSPWTLPLAIMARRHYIWPFGQGTVILWSWY